MQLNRTINSKKNIFWGIINRLVKIGVPFAVRTVIIYELGINYVGLNSLFASILSSLSLAELGFDTAIVTVMYKAIAENDRDNIRALLCFIKKAYYFVGMVIIAAGICCIPFLKYLVKDFSAVPNDVDIRLLFILFLLNTVVTYFFGGYRTCVLEAYQRLDVVSNTNSICTISCSIIQIIVLLLRHNYYLYVMVMIVTSVLMNIIIFAIVKRKYPDIIPVGKVSKDEMSHLKKILIGTFWGKMGSVLSVSFDYLIISSALGLTILAYYSNYSYIISAITGFLVIIYTSMQAGIGNSIVLEPVKKNYDDMMRLTFLYNWIVSWCSICLFYLFTPFIQLWIGEVGVLPDVVMAFIVLDFYVVLCGGIQGTYKNACGIWWEDRYRCLFGGVCNLFINIVLVILLRKYGEYYALLGVVLSTMLSDLFILTPWSIHVTFKHYFHDGEKEYVMSMLKYFGCTVLNILICFPIMYIIKHLFQMSTFLIFLFRGIVLIAMPNLLFFLFYRKTEICKRSFIFLKNQLTKNK